MDKILHLKILKANLDEDYFKVLSYDDKSNSYYIVDKDFSEIEKDFHNFILSKIGDGINITIEESEKNISIRIILYFTADTNFIIEYFDKLFNRFNEKYLENEFENLSFEHHLLFELLDVNSLTFNEINSFLISKGFKDFKIIRRKNIFEKGASNLEEDFLISIAANFATKALKSLYKYIKRKIKSKNKVFNSYDLKCNSLFLDQAFFYKLSELAKIDIKDFYLSRYNMREDKKIDITFRSKSKFLYITCDNKMNIEKFNMKNITKSN